MDLTPEQIEELFTKEVPDVQICLHECRIKPVSVDVDGKTTYGYVARLMGHCADDKPMTIDFVTVETILQETMSRFIGAGMTAAFATALDTAVSTGSTDGLLAILATINFETEGN